MNRDKAREITRDRLERWIGRLDPATATPVLLIGVGHGTHSGELHVCVAEDILDAQLLYFLEFAHGEILRRFAGYPRVMDQKADFDGGQTT